MVQRSMEIERKWLVKEIPNLSDSKRVSIKQGYVASSNKIEVRLRQQGKKFFHTIKTGTGLERTEIEVELSKKQFQKLWHATRGRRLEKVRYSLKWRGKTLELDLYKNELAGLSVAEVEFKTKKQAAKFSPPQWFGKEITGKRKYSNAQLATKQNRPKV